MGIVDSDNLTICQNCGSWIDVTNGQHYAIEDGESPQPTAPCMQDLFGEVISTYSRQQAIEDGVLIDVSTIAAEAGFRFPVALTQALWTDYVKPCEKDKAKGQSEQGRLWDLLHMLHMAIKGAIPARTFEGPGPGQTTLFSLYFILKGRRKLVKVKAICGPGDDLEPVITIMLPEED